MPKGNGLLHPGISFYDGFPSRPSPCHRAQAGEWPAGTDPALAARLFTAGLYGLMARWHLNPGSLSWDAAAAALAGSEP
jgi:hypothetical protein